MRVTQPIKVITKEGEATVHITLELNINLNTSGLSVSVGQNGGKEEEVKEEKEKTQWAIPEFGPTKKIEFGKTV